MEDDNWHYIYEMCDIISNENEVKRLLLLWLLIKEKPSLYMITLVLTCELELK